MSISLEKYDRWPTVWVNLITFFINFGRVSPINWTPGKLSHTICNMLIKPTNWKTFKENLQGTLYEITQIKFMPILGNFQPLISKGTPSKLGHYYTTPSPHVILKDFYSDGSLWFSLLDFCFFKFVFLFFFFLIRSCNR